MRSLRALLVGCVVIAGCAQDDVEAARKKMAKEGAHVATPSPAPHGGPAGSAGGPGGAPHSGAGGGMGMDVSGPTDGNAIPLKLTGSGSAEELQRALGRLSDASHAADFERAFRLTFTTVREQRDYGTARGLLSGITQAEPKFAPAYRTLGYAVFSLNPADAGPALAAYNQAVQLDPAYGEAHYAIAFMHAMTQDRATGLAHYRKAIELGVVDERNIGERFYGDLLKQP